MLRIEIKGQELFDEASERFVTTPGVSVDLEHSLVSLSKWESIHQIPFLSAEKMKAELMLDYLKCMILTEDVDDDILYNLTQDDFDKIQDYINDPYTATTFGRMPDRKGPEETITSELIYYWLVAFNIPFEVETWHLNRLFALIRICNIKNSKQKKRSPGEILAERNRINAERKAKLGTTG